MRTPAALLLLPLLLAAPAPGAEAPPPGDPLPPLPLILPPSPPGPGPAFAILATGDGGWAELDREVAKRLAAGGLPVVGWDSRAYYWTKRTPEEAAADLARIIAHFRPAWQRPRVVLVGYSRGADVMPFLANRLESPVREALGAVILLGPGSRVAFEFHLTDFLHPPDPRTSLPVVAEIARLAASGVPVAAICGENDRETPLADLRAAGPIVRVVPGDHHFAKDFDGLARLILALAEPRPVAAFFPSPRARDRPE